MKQKMPIARMVVFWSLIATFVVVSYCLYLQVRSQYVRMAWGEIAGSNCASVCPVTDSYACSFIDDSGGDGPKGLLRRLTTFGPDYLEIMPKAAPNYWIVFETRLKNSTAGTPLFYYPETGEIGRGHDWCRVRPDVRVDLNKLLGIR